GPGRPPMDVLGDARRRRPGGMGREACCPRLTDAAPHRPCCPRAARGQARRLGQLRLTRGHFSFSAPTLRGAEYRTHLNADRLFATSGPPDIMRWRSPPTGLSAPDGTVFEPHLNPLSGWMGSNPEFSRPRSFRNRLEISLG